MKKLILPALLLILSACGGYRKSTITPVDGRIVTRVIEFVDSPWWRSSGYANLQDVSVPYTVVFAADDTACPIYTILMNPIRKGEVYQCPTRWIQRH